MTDIASAIIEAANSKAPPGKVARAIADVQLFPRFNDWTSDCVKGLPIEICRYGREDALRDVVREERARVAIEAMREPTDGMLRSAVRYGDSGGYGRIDEVNAEIVWEDMINAALKEPA